MEEVEVHSFKEWFTSVSWSMYEDGLEEHIKKEVIHDFALKLGIIFIENPIFPNCIGTYELFNRRFGFEREFYGENGFEDGEEIETEDVLEECKKVFTEEFQIEIKDDDLRSLFGSGEFPFLKIRIMKEREVMYYGYRIVR